MKNYNYNENTGDLEIPLDSLSDGLLYANKKNIHNIKITNTNTNTNTNSHVDYESALAPLVGCDSVFSIYIADDINLKKINLEPLYSLKNIKKLSMQYLKGHVDFSKIRTLETLYITKADDKIENLSIDGLKELLLVSIRNFDCKFISSLSNLKTLRISTARMVNLSGIESLDALESLKLTYCPDLIDISKISNLKKLADLHVEKCKRINDFSFLRKNETVAELFLSNVESLDFIPTMKNIRHLKFWELRDGELNYLLRSYTLKQVDFHPQKKHYTHKKEEINNIINKRDISS